MFLAKSKEADGKSQIPAGHHNLLRGGSHVWGRSPVYLPLLGPPYETSHACKAVAHPQKHVQRNDIWVKGHKCEHHEGDQIESHLNCITDTDKGWLPHSRIDDAGKVGESRCQQKRIYQLHTKEEEHVF